VSQPGQWQVAGSAPEVYERELVPAVFGEWAPIVVELAHPGPGERVVDVACGTGIVARIAAARVGPTGVVVGIDLRFFPVPRKTFPNSLFRCVGNLTVSD
jgi:2-polyprenyl-3-methyl-5-hydroxy-6-metoxy-1,4-benzoquinol methylase